MENTHGGNRENAGRKMQGDQKKVVVSVALDAENLEALKGENRSKKLLMPRLKLRDLFWKVTKMRPGRIWKHS